MISKPPSPTARPALARQWEVGPPARQNTERPQARAPAAPHRDVPPGPTVQRPERARTTAAALPQPRPRPPAPQPPAPEQPAPQRPAPQRPLVAPTSPNTASRTPDPTTGVRISKLITERGLASRREADDWIAAGWVRAAGKLAVLGQRVAADAVIDIDPRARAEQARLVTILLNKPMGYVSGQPEDGHEPAVTLLKAQNRWPGDTMRLEFHPGHLRHLAPAGRLDIDSTGLIVFTQDGRVAKRLIGDQTRVEKEYLVRVALLGEGVLSEVNLAPLRQGLSLDSILLRPAQVSWQNEDQLRFVLREGRKRQIRRMCELVGLQVLGLKRVRIGSVPLGDRKSVV